MFSTITGDGGCVQKWDEHANYTDTGQRGVNELTGSTYEVWACECGQRTIDRFPFRQVTRVFCVDCQGNGQVWDGRSFTDCGTCFGRCVIWVDPNSATNYQSDCSQCSGSGATSDGYGECLACDGVGVVNVFGIAGEDEEG